MRNFFRFLIAVMALVFVAVSCKKEPVTPPEPQEQPDYVSVKDPRFKAYLLSTFDTDKDGGISLEEAQSVKEINCSEMGIESLSGIRCFTNLEKLDCSKNAISELVFGNATKADVAEGECAKLKSIDCSGNKVTTISLNSCPELTQVNVSGNNISEIDLSSNPALTEVNVSGNEITEIDLSNNPELTSVDVSGNNISEIDLSSNPALTEVNVSGNEITEIDLSNNPELTSVDVSGNNISEIDLSSNPALTEVNVSGNEITEIDLSNNPELTSVDVSGNNISEIDLSNNPALTEVNVSGNEITEIDLSNNPELTSVDVSGNNITEIDLSNNPALTELNVSDNNITDLDLSANTGLTNVDCSGNEDLSKIVVPEGSDVDVNVDEGQEVQTVTEIPTEGVSLDNTSIELTEGEEITLNATVSPEDATNKNVVWSSSDETVASVDASGKVSALKVGTATITVKTKNGGKTATCAVTVKAKEIPVTGVALDKTSAELTEEESVTLVATIEPGNATNKDVEWSSSDETVASVDASGKVSALKVGTATITVKTKNGGKTATCAVTVKAKEIPVTGVALDKTSAELTEGESVTLVATIEPGNATNKDVEWSSSDAAVASVDASGKVSALKVGSATITVKTKDGGKTATCTVTVKAKVIAVTGISLDQTSVKLAEGESVTLVATIEPGNATDKDVEWSSSDAAVASVDASGKVSALKVGSATITVKTKDGGKTATCAVTVDVPEGGSENVGFENW